MFGASEPHIITLIGTSVNLNGLGASIHVDLDDGTVLSGWNHDGSGFQSSSAVPVMFAIPQDANRRLYACGGQMVINK